MATKFACGAECGIGVVGTTSAGVEHWSAVGAASDVTTSNPRTGSRTYLFFLLSADTTDFREHTFGTAISSGGTMVKRIYLRVDAGPANSGERRTLFSTPDGLSGVYMQNVFGTIVLGAWAGNAAPTEVTGPGISTGGYYQLDVSITRGTTITVAWSVDGVPQTSATKGSQTSVTIPGFRLGSNGSGTGANSSTTCIYYMDDIYIDDSAAAYPIGAGAVAGLYPTGDRTNSAANPTDGNFGHLYSATTDFGDGSGGASALAAQNAETDTWQSLANPLSTSIATNFVADLTGSSTEHLVWTHEALPTVADRIHGVMVTMTSHSATTTGNQFKMQLSDAAGNTAAVVTADLSETTITVPVAVVANAPSGAAWNPALVNDCFFRFGDSADVAPDVYCDGAMLEVAYAERPPHRLIYPQVIGR